MQHVVVYPDSPFVFLCAGGQWYYYNYNDPPIGEGAMGVVYLGFNYQTNARIAIKRVRDEWAEMPIVRSYARREASLIFNHPNIVRMIGLCEYQYGHGPMFILSEYIHGVTFLEMVKTRMSGFPDEARAYRIADNIRPILSAIQYLHNNGVVHKDIKPSNIMINNTACVKLMDLGVSNFIQSNKVQKGFVGTPDYAAPEQIPDEHQEAMIFPQTDIYSFGVTLYELITGENPFVGNSDAETLDNHKHKRLPTHDKLPGPLYRIIRKAVEKNPTDRYNSANEMDNELEEAIRDYGKESKVDSNNSSKAVLIILVCAITLACLILAFYLS